MTDDSTEFVLNLSKDEALVLFEFVSRFRDTDVLELQDRAEAQTLWNVCCLLEQQLVEPLLPNYRDFLESARDRLRPPDLTD